MRDYFLTKLERLEAMTGLKQFEKMRASDDFDQLITDLLDELERVCSRYQYLPDDKKMRIIDAAMMADDNLIAITPKKIYSYLSKFWCGLNSTQIQEFVHPKKRQEESKGLPPDEAQKYIDILKRNIEMIAEPPIKTATIRISPSGGRASVKIKQKIVDCPKCHNHDKEKRICGHCMGYGRIKIIDNKI